MNKNTALLKNRILVGVGILIFLGLVSRKGYRSYPIAAAVTLLMSMINLSVGVSVRKKSEEFWTGMLYRMLNNSAFFPAHSHSTPTLPRDYPVSS